MLRHRHGGAKVSSQVGVLFALDGLGPPLAEDVAVVHLLSEAFGPMDPFVCQTFDRFQCKEWSLQETVDACAASLPTILQFVNLD